MKRFTGPLASLRNIRREAAAAMVVATLFAVIGVAVIRLSLAATMTASAETEAGSLSGSATSGTDDTASGKGFVRFGGTDKGDSPLYSAVCAKNVATTTLGTVKSSSFTEISGITASRTTDDTYWVHNDSGDSARIFSVSGNGTLLGTFNLSGAKATDWEDIASGPGPVSGQSYIYVADTGNNDLDRKTVQVYRLPEPVPDNGGNSKTVSGVETLNFTYSDGAAHNVEAVFVDPSTSEVYLIDKDDSRAAQIYKSQPDPAAGSTTVVSKVGTLSYKNGSDFEKVTSADISPGGNTIAVRTYEHLYVYNRPAGNSIANALSGTACTVPVLSEPKGEAVGFMRSGNGMVTTSEGDKQPIFAIRPK